MAKEFPSEYVRHGVWISDHHALARIHYDVCIMSTKKLQFFQMTGLKRRSKVKCLWGCIMIDRSFIIRCVAAISHRIHLLNRDVKVGFQLQYDWTLLTYCLTIIIPIKWFIWKIVQNAFKNYFNPFCAIHFYLCSKLFWNTLIYIHVY